MLRTIYTWTLLLLSTQSFAQQSEKVKLLCNWNDTSIAVNRIGQYYSDVWGFVWNGKEYAAIGSTSGVHIIDVANCRQAAFEQSSALGPNIIHRDYKVYKHYLYAVCDETDSARLEIYDISHLPDSLHLVYRSTASEVGKTHNLFIDTTKGKLYLGIYNHLKYYPSIGTYARVTDNMGVFSLANPEHPVLLTTFKEINYIHDMYVRNDTAYCSASESGYVVVDFSKNTSYDIIGYLPDYDYKGYNHSSWINSKGIGVMADETHGMPIKVIDTREINNITVRSNFMPKPGDTACIPHNPYILNDDYVLISYYFDGLQIFNISNPDSPYRAGYYDTYPGPDYKGYMGAWGCYPYLPSRKILISDMQTGLYVFDADSAMNLISKTAVTFKPQSPFNIYPNPVKDKLYVSLPYEEGDAALAICDMQGKCIFKQAIHLEPLSNQPIELTLPANCPKGVYTVRVVTGSNSYTAKFTKSQN